MSRAINPNDPLDMNFLVELPYEIQVTHISNMSDVKSTWRKGIQTIQDMFAEHIEKMTQCFEAKTETYEVTRS